MSTPSTATSTIPAHQSHYSYASHNPYPSNTAAYSANASVRLPALPATYQNYSTTTGYSRPRQSSFSSKQASASQAPPTQPTAPSSSKATPTMNGHNNRQPDWAEFYKNGVPKEVIVIDDTPEPERRPKAQPRRPNKEAVAPSGKKRKVGGDYETRVPDRPSYSTHSQQYGDSSGPSISTDRTASLQTTAPTSLGSYGSSGASNSYEDVNVGSKRKRLPVKETRSQAKRKQQEADNDAFANYVPPPKPPIKAGEVPVPVIRAQYYPNTKVDDDDGHYIVTPDADLTERYSIIRLLGQGTFGKVVEAYDKKKRTKCAVKVIRSVQKYRDASRIELRVLSTLALNDKTNRNKCIHLRDCFDFRNHICIVTDLLGQSVFDFLKGNGFVPFPSTQIQSFARQLFTSVAFLHDLNLIHTDLKPENILLVSNQYQTFTYNRNIPSSSHSSTRHAKQRRVLLDSEIRLIDFGSATFDDEYHSSVVSTRHYRAPEIILNLGWSFPCDIWSIGCILVEFFTGDALFQTHDNLEHLAMMEAVCDSRVEAKMVKSVMSGSRGNNPNSAAKYFNRLKLDYPNNETTRASRKYVKAMKSLKDFIPETNDFNRQFLDLLKRIFVYDPKHRITAKQALQHPWFKESLVDDGTEALRIRETREHEAREAKRLRGS